ncbi:MAG: polynucleotide adenylyltransferase PcnB [Ketobacteraceae bacterium]|nr:polynucleotide adenylyltransferase PcnB [Ketobacteraceae bacterium]
MPKRLFSKIKSLISDSPRVTAPSPRIIGPEEHQFRPEAINRNAIKVVETLTRDGHEAYIVGGCVRDGLLGKIPKDFDVATSAHPEEIKALFRNCRLVGRRFRLAHVRFGREIIEVATFRGSHSNAGSDDKHESAQSDEGLLLRDNVFGTLDEDAIRRDFTANALYYDHDRHSIIDYVDGYRDIETRTLRLIGDPEQRYKEDPVRMLRAIRFAAKLEFTMTRETEQPIFEHADLLNLIPAARLFDEIQKLFLSGAAAGVWQLLKHYGVAGCLFPNSTPEENPLPAHQAMIDQVMINTDRRIADDKPVTPAFLFAVMLWGPLNRRWEEIKAEGMPPVPAFQKAMQLTISEQTQFTSIPKRFVIPLREIWELQLKLPQRGAKRINRTFEHPRFRAAYDLLLLREDAGEIEPGLGQWWTDFQEADEDQRQTMINAQGGESRNRNTRRRRRRRSGRKGYNNRPDNNGT